MIQLILFVTAAALLTIGCWRVLRNPGCHGFPRYFAFLGIAALVSLNAPYWVQSPFSPWQLASWFLLFTSAALVSSGLYLLRRKGGYRYSAQAAENFGFENTGKLVDEGIYGIVRHPMYSALLLLTWGVLVKHISIVGLCIAVAATICIYITAKVEEQENLDFFGPAYQAYMSKTQRFLPFLL